MSEKLYRQKNLDRINSPEQLEDYIRVSNPGVWLLLVSLVALLAGACIWGMFGQMETTEPIKVQAKDGVISAYVSPELLECLHVGMEVRFDDAKGVVSSVEEAAENGQVIVYVDAQLEEGIHAGKLVVESIHPISFIMN